MSRVHHSWRCLKKSKDMIRNGIRRSAVFSLDDDPDMHVEYSPKTRMPLKGSRLYWQLADPQVHYHLSQYIQDGRFNSWQQNSSPILFRTQYQSDPLSTPMFSRRLTAMPGSHASDRFTLAHPFVLKKINILSTDPIYSNAARCRKTQIQIWSWSPSQGR